MSQPGNAFLVECSLAVCEALIGPDGENGACGGWSLQHASDSLYQDFKRQLVVDALKSKALRAENKDFISDTENVRLPKLVDAGEASEGFGDEPEVLKKPCPSLCRPRSRVTFKTSNRTE